MIDLDYLRIRTQADVGAVLAALQAVFPAPLVRTIGKAREGFQRAETLAFAENVINADDAVATVLWGGESQRGWVHVVLTGKGCDWLQAFDGWAERWARNFETLPRYEVRRCDLALTTLHGEVTHERVVQAHAEGQFTVTHPVAMQTIVSTDPTAGRTCYVGKRTSGKMLRAYEKGRELAAKAQPLQLTHYQGQPIEQVYRVEVEFKATDRDLPASIVHQRAEYFAGAYPFCRSLLAEVAPQTTRLHPREVEALDIARSLENVRVQYGAALRRALLASGGDITAIWDAITDDPRPVSLPMMQTA
jgi:DNA relaxase NicK